MARVTPKGLQVWDLLTDQFDHTQLSGNWDLIDSLLGSPTQSVETLSSIPSVGNFSGRLVLLDVANGGFSAWTLIRYDGATWQPINQIEVQPSVPTQGNFGGRVVILSAASGGFPAWAIIRYDGSTWGIIGGWQSVNTGSGSVNIQGLTTSGDVLISNSNRGLVLTDRITSTTYRLFFRNGNLAFEVVD